MKELSVADEMVVRLQGRGMDIKQPPQRATFSIGVTNLSVVSSFRFGFQSHLCGHLQSYLIILRFKHD